MFRPVRPVASSIGDSKAGTVNVGPKRGPPCFRGRGRSRGRLPRVRPGRFRFAGGCLPKKGHKQRLYGWFQQWADIEAQATVLRWYEPLVVPGLLQTEDYARAILSARPDGNLSDLDAPSAVPRSCAASSTAWLR